MGLLIAPHLAAFTAITAILPLLLTMLILTAAAVGLVDLLALFDMDSNQRHAKSPGLELIPPRVLIALHEPSLGSMTEPRADAPSRAPPSCRHLFQMTAPPGFTSRALSRRFDFGALSRA